MYPCKPFLTLLLSAGAAHSAVVPSSGANLERATSCTFTDAASAMKAKTSCLTITLDSLAVIFEGRTTFGYSEWSGPLVSVSGTDITVTGAPDSVLDGQGALWWDGKGTNGGKEKPKFFYAHNMISSTITGISILNSPVQVFSIDNSQDLVLNGIIIDDSAGDAGALGHNTDAFDVGDSTGVTISGANVKNQDDCLAINSGTKITFTGGTCSGGHGLSIGSVGGRSDNSVSNVLIENSSVTKSQNGIRIKTSYDATGSVKGVTYKNIKLSNISKYGIVIEQDYENGKPTGSPSTGVPITDLVIESISGTVASSAQDVYILCGSSASCSEWTWTGVDVVGGTMATTCKNVPSGASC
ncbi:hypothetical protein BDR22DRAFT_899853 [Usnea florida]